MHVHPGPEIALDRINDHQPRLIFLKRALQYRHVGKGKHVFFAVGIHPSGEDFDLATVRSRLFEPWLQGIRQAVFGREHDRRVGPTGAQRGNPVLIR